MVAEPIIIRPETMMSPVILLALVCVGTWLLTWLLMRLGVRRQWMDEPGGRHLHTQRTPRGAGLAMGVLFLMGLTVAYANAWVYPLQAWGTLLSAVSLVLVLGFWDDLKPLPVSVRLLGHLVAVIVVLWGIVWPVWATSTPYGGVMTWLALGMAGLLMLSMVNFWNFMDGSDGLATVQALFVFAVCVWLGLQADDMWLIWMGCLGLMVTAGFLPWNWPAAKVFMGDAGSTTLGFLVGFSVVAGWLVSVKLGVLLLLSAAPFWLDAGCTLLVRLLQGKPWHQGHTDHVYQLFRRNGLSATQLLLWWLGINVLCVLPCLWLLHWLYDDVLPETLWLLSVVTLMMLMFCAWWLLRARALKQLKCSEVLDS